MNGRVLLYPLIVLMVVFWSANYIIGKIALREFPPLLLSGVRVAMAGALMLPAYWWESHKHRNGRWTRGDVSTLLYLGLLGVALNQFFFVMGLSRTSVAHSAIINGLTPVLVLLLAAMMHLERLSTRRAVGMAVALAGVAVLKWLEPRSVDGAGPTWLGDSFIFLGSLAFALFTVFGKRVTERHSSVTVNTFAYVGGALALAPLTLWQASRHPIGRISLTAWICVLYMALFSSVISYLIYYYALERIAASRVAAFSYLQPLLATLMGVTLLGERLTGAVIVGGTVIFFGVYLAERA